jgi:Flp pilus assembly CpaF family ATPase
VTDVMVPDEVMIRRMRTAVSGELLARVAAAQNGGLPLDVMDQRALASHLIEEQTERLAQDRMTTSQPELTEAQELVLKRAVFDRLFNHGRLQPLIDDDRIVNIHANGCDQVFIEYADGTVVSGPPIADSDEEMLEMIREYGRRYGLSERELNPAHPSIEVQLPEGHRFFGIAWVCERPCIAIRRHRFMRVTLADELRMRLMDRGLAGLLAASVKSDQNIMIAGPTGAGKTTLLRALAAEIPPMERLITAETDYELGLHRFPEQHHNCMGFEARRPNVEGAGEISLAYLVRDILRMDPGRVIVGEVRGDEIVPMLQAMSQGNAGSMCTIHADSSAGVFNRIALYAMQSPQRFSLEVANQMAAEALDLVVFIAKRRGQRYVSSVRHVERAEDRIVVTNEIFRPGPDGRAVPGCPIPHDLLEELVDAGYVPSLHHNPDGWWDQ